MNKTLTITAISIVAVALVGAGISTMEKANAVPAVVGKYDQNVCILIDGDGAGAFLPCSVLSITTNSAKNNFYVQFRGDVEPPSDGKAKKWNKANTGFNCGFRDANDNLRLTEDWQSIVSASGNAFSKCKFKN